MTMQGSLVSSSGDDEWKTTIPNKSKSRVIKRRVFIGSLRFSSKLEHKLRDLFSQSAIAIRGDIQIDFPKHLQQEHTGSLVRIEGSACFALVECDIEMAIKCLHGRMFDGNYLAVKLEKKQSNGRKNIKKFGGGWTKPQKSRSIPDRKKHLPSSNDESINSDRNDSLTINHMVPPLEEDDIATLSQDINDFVSDQLKEREGDDGLNVGIACTTAVVALLSAKNSGSVEPEVKIIQAKETPLNLNSGGTSKSENEDDVLAFHSKFKSAGLSQLVNEYGKYDACFEKTNIVTKKDTHLPSSTHSMMSTKQKEEIKGNASTRTRELNGMLAPNGKAPIHVQLVSFGYKYSVPPQARDGWSHSNPLSPMDCRDLPRAPHYVAKLSGLSFKVKQALLRECYNNTKTEENTGNESAAMGEKEHSGKNVNQLKLKGEDIGSNVLKAIEEAIHDGGHGYGFPLEITVYIGSEYGRHRSVVLCEIAAQTIRGMLRKSSDDKITDPVSVSTRHRDVDNNHRDDEAFGKDLKREHEVEARRKKKQERLEDRY